MQALYLSGAACMSVLCKLEGSKAVHALCASLVRRLQPVLLQPECWQ